MGSTPFTRDHRTLIAAASLVVGPLLMSIGDLLHPKESMDTAAQIAIIVEQATRWYAAHLLLFVGILLLIPGLVALPDIAAESSPTAGHAARLLLLIGVAAFAAIFVGEMLIGRFVTDGASRATASALLDTMFSGPMTVAVGPGALAFFVGTGTLAVPLIRAGGARRWTASLLSIGALLILAEIVSAQVVLSQIGNVLMLAGGTVASWLTLKGAGAPRAVE